MIQTIESRKQAQTGGDVDDIALPYVCAYFLAPDSALLPYIVWSNLFFILLFSYLYFNKELFFPIEPNRTKQLIDIEFVSPTDYKNKKDLLPSTIPKPSLGKKMSPAEEAIIPRTLATPQQADPKPDQPQHKEFVYAINCPRKTSIDTFNSVIRLPTKSKSGTDKPALKPQKSLTTELDLEEVAPLALTEVKDNDGDNSLELWQDGGHSNNGLGATTALTNYLKDLHKKLKHSWSPPSGPARHIKVLFRLAADGKLISLKLLDSSGDSSADNSALEAVAKAAPFGKLPKDYPSHFLDLVYTFNYSTDELNEVPPPSIL